MTRPHLFRARLFRHGPLACLALFLAIATPARAETPAYVGSAVCADCHADVTTGWATSDHAHAWTLPDETTVLGDFDNAEFEHGGQLTRFLRDGDRFLIETEGPDGVRRAYDVVGVAGIDPLQQYLLSPEPGRVQTYDIAWDVEAARWYPVFPDQVALPGDGFHWTGPYKNWDGRCAECHATGYSRNYSPVTDSFKPQMTEIGVGCEACHGPGAAHLSWAKDPDSFTPAAGLSAVGLTADLGASQDDEVMQCLTLRQGIYHPDGSILDEVFEGGSFLQSRMYGMGVRCSDCHDPHEATLKAEGNGVCTQCHSPAGNPRFPSLPLQVFDGPEHHFHPEGSAGAQCVACHMIERTYMGVDERRDHSFRVPRPDLAYTGSPDACTDCHTDQTAAWAAEEIAARFPDSSHRGPHYATTFSAAWISPQQNVDDLLAIAEGADLPGIVRATALEIVGAAMDPQSTDRVSRLLADPDPLVRVGAAGALRTLPPPDRLALLRPLLSDPSRSVREAAARALLDTASLPDTASDPALQAALAEWQQALKLRADFPETHLQIGGAALTSREFDLALAAFRQAVTLDPQLVDAWSIIVRLQAAMGNPEGALASLTEGLAANPQSQTLRALVPSDQ